MSSVNNDFHGDLTGSDYKVAIVVAQFNAAITGSLLEGAIDAFRTHGVAAENISVYRVPGALEIPLTCDKLVKKGGIDGVLTLGAVIRGETTHYDYVAGGCAAGVQKVSLESGLPVLFGVLTTENIEQAWNRAGLKSGNKGAETAIALMQLISMYRKARI